MSMIVRMSDEVPEKDNLIFIGYMGAGKTSVGEECALLAGAKLLDTDELIEKEMEVSISDIFDEFGEPAFRDLETLALKRLITSTDHCVISVGGGLPVREENRELLKQLGTIVFLRVKRDTALKRLEGDTSRPLLMVDDREEKIDRMLEERDPIYLDCCHWVIDTDEYTPQEIALEALDAAGWSILT